MEEHVKEVRYDLYCKKCKHYELPQDKEPCHDCLNQPWNVDSKKPIYFKEK